jgi:uncharacterized protein (UPF0333 family)
MTTPADWYPDPDDSTGLRYWDGAAWTEHRTSATPPPAPVQPPHAGSHRVPDAGSEPETVGQAYTPTPSQPYDTHPTTSYEAPSYEAPRDQPSYEAPAIEAPQWEAPPSAQPSYASTPGSYETPSYPPPSGPPPSAAPSGGGPNTKLAFGIIGGAAAILLVIVVVLVVVIIRKDDTTVTASKTTSSSTAATTTTSEATSETESSATEAPPQPPAGAQGSDGDYTFSVARIETGDTITSTVNDSVETNADGMYYVVHLNVTNTGTAPLTFVATFQALNAAGQTFPLDDEATAFLGGTVATIDPGAQVETPLVYDVPAGTEPDSILLRADPSTAGVEIPLR